MTWQVAEYQYVTRSWGETAERVKIVATGLQRDAARQLVEELNDDADLMSNVNAMWYVVEPDNTDPGKGVWDVDNP